MFVFVADEYGTHDNKTLRLQFWMGNITLWENQDCKTILRMLPIVIYRWSIDPGTVQWYREETTVACLGGLCSDLMVEQI